MSASESPAPSQIGPPRWIFGLDMGYLALLAAVAIIWGVSPSVRKWFKPAGNDVPVAVLWWGALGAVTISLDAVFRHARDWDPHFYQWHIARPAVGAVLGAVSYLIFVVVLQAAGSPTRDHGALIYYLVAFLVGYRETTFRELIKRATDMLLAPSAAGSAAASSTKSQADHPPPLASANEPTGEPPNQEASG